MYYIAGGLLLLSMAMVLIHMVIAYRVLKSLSHCPQPPYPDEKCPKAMVVMCLRGSDPFLEATLRSIFAQDYPHYVVKLIVDSVHDTAWGIVHRIKEELHASHVTIQPHLKRRAGCSLKCGSQIEALETIDPSIEILAFLDADTVPHATWLRELAAALNQPGVGAATGTLVCTGSCHTWGCHALSVECGSTGLDDGTAYRLGWDFGISAGDF